MQIRIILASIVTHLSCLTNYYQIFKDLKYSFFKIFTWLIMAIVFISCNNEKNSSDNKGEKNETETVKSETDSKEKILFFGNSLTAGYGLTDQQEAFPSLIQQKIDSLNLPYQVINGGLSGETSAGGNERIDWLLKQPISIFVLELGANDGLRGIDPNETYKHLSDIIKKVRDTYPDCKLVLTGMLVPPSMGSEYTTKFKAIFPKLAEEYDMELVPFLLDKVAGISNLNQKDGVHPTAEGQRILADNVWLILKPLL